MTVRTASSASRRWWSRCRSFPTAIFRMSRSTDNDCSIANIARREMIDAAAVAVWMETGTGIIMAESASLEVQQLQPRGAPPPLHRIADHCAVFLDFDGTLTNLERRPDQVVVDGGLLYLLDDLYVATAGATAVISGRAIEDLDAKLTPLRLPLAGIHGAQRRRADGSIEKCAIPATVVWQTRMGLRMRLRRYQGLYLEDKGTAFAVHY